MEERKRLKIWVKAAILAIVLVIALGGFILFRTVAAEKQAKANVIEYGEIKDIRINISGGEGRMP